MSNLNQSAIRKHALVCSKQLRGGRFTRVGQDFIDELEADLETLIRELGNKYPVPVHAEIGTEECFVPGPTLDRIGELLNRAVARLIQNKICKQPSVGVTAGRTR